MKVILIEDQNLLAITLIHALEQDNDIEVVGHSDKASDVLQLCEEHQPDLVIMDVFTREGNGIDYTAKLKRRFPEIKVMVITGIEDDHLVKNAETAGADVFVRKDITLDELRELIRYASKSYRVFPKTSLAPDEPVKLSTVDIQIIAMLAQGKDSREIAGKLFLSYGTVRLYISRMYSVTGSKSRAQLVTFALRHGLLEPV